eukprot:CAMPEP_0173111866 /NCGR_PEP_ID=MMETSP1102-20130122/45536_1 /TAXON_ID=49646 /ORGANISM="Geminigera sp., Strain Caron Lab Isolate" /LENGTH=229 /DNA_ID=CAMNT_0014012545 /DNA_START=8 /DNA_END=697 /DNA_ORIENTATION=+
MQIHIAGQALTFRVPDWRSGPDWFSFWTHAWGLVFAIVGTILMLFKSTSAVAFVSALIYGGCNSVLFFASSLHHTVKRPASNEAQSLLRRFDHISIYLMIAGSYTPICLVALEPKNGLPMLAVAWGLGLAGVAQKVFLEFSPRWATIGTYLVMGWCSIAMWNPLNRLFHTHDLFLLVFGGVLYSLGAVVYASKFPDILPDLIGFHGLWHVFVLVAAFCHFWFIYRFVIV